MKLKIEIDIDNDAFLYDGELAHVLGKIGAIASECEGEKTTQKIMDSNGNTVGSWSIIDQ